MADKLTCSIIDTVNKRRLTAGLLDEQGREVDLEETVKTLLDYLKSKLSIEETRSGKDPVGKTIREAVLPVVSAAAITSLEELLGPEMTGYLLADKVIKMVMVRLVLTGYALHSLVEQNKFSVKTDSSPVTDQEITQLVRLEDLSDLITKASASGIDPKQAVAELIRRELLTADDLRAYGLEEDLVQALVSLVKKADTSSNNKAGGSGDLVN